METRSSPSMSELHAIAASRGLKNYMRLSKPELFSLLQRKEGGGSAARPAAASDNHNKQESGRPAEHAGDSTADHGDRPATAPTSANGSKATRSSERLSTKKAKRKADDECAAPTKKSKLVTNTLDPIMFVELGSHTFEFERPNGSVVLYNVESLVQYILATGDFSEPQTRIPFSDDDLRRMDAEAKRAELDEKSVWKAKQNKHEFEERKVERDGILGLERCAGDYVAKMLGIVEEDNPEEGAVELLMSLFPSFSHVFHQIRRADAAYAIHCMDHFKSFVRGPKNRPTEDNSGLLESILDFLDNVGNGNQDASTFGF